MEPKSNEEVQNPYAESQSNETRDDYTEVEKQVMQKMQQYDQNESPSNQQSSHPDYTPENSIQTAHLLLSPSEAGQQTPENTKEIILANLNEGEKYAIFAMQNVWDDMQWIRKQQKRRVIENLKMSNPNVDLNNIGNIYEEGVFSEEEKRLNEIEQLFQEEEGELLDETDMLRRSFRLATLSRGTYGFERTKQVETINSYNMETNDRSQSAPGFMQKVASFAGGFKRGGSQQ